VKYFTVLTLQLGDELVSMAQVITVDDGTTRSAIYHFMHDQVAADRGDRWANAAITFFSADPDNFARSPS
jgi:hypothetical protein